jgi:hypothetical protein
MVEVHVVPQAGWKTEGQPGPGGLWRAYAQQIKRLFSGRAGKTLAYCIRHKGATGISPYYSNNRGGGGRKKKGKEKPVREIRVKV